MKRISLIPILILVFFSHSCNDEGGCTDIDLISRVSAGFHVRGGEGERDTLLNNLTFFGELRPDSLIYDASNNVRGIEFPLPHIAEAFTGFVFRVDTLTDMIEIWHTPKLELFSYACGYITTHEIYAVSYDTTIIDTIVIVNSYVNLEEDEENLEIYIRPAAPAADTAR